MISHHKLGKIGLVLPGGFVKGAFQAGALKVFEENDVIPSYVVGVSAGAMNGAAFVSGQIDELIQTYKDIAEKPHKYLYHLSTAALVKALWTDSILVNTPLKRLIRARLNPQVVVSSPILFEVLATDYQAGEEVVFSNANPEHKGTDVFLNALLASSAMPTIFPPVEYGGHQLFDGVVMEQAPLSYALRQKCDTVFIIMNEAQSNLAAPRRFNSVYSIARRTSQLMSWRSSEGYLGRVSDTNNDKAAYEKLRAGVVGLLDRACEGPEGSALKDDVTRLFDDTHFSFQDKKRVAIYRIEPDIVDNMRERANTSFIFDWESIERYLESGYERTKRILHELDLLKA